MVFPKSSSWTGTEPGRSDSVIFPLTHRMNLHQGDKMEYEGIVLISPDLLDRMNEEFQSQPAGQRTMELRFELILPALEFETKRLATESIPAFNGGFMNKFEPVCLIQETVWMRWLRAWGYQTTILYVPDKILSRIRTVMKRDGYELEWQPVSTALSLLEGEKHKTVLLRGNAVNQAFKDRILELINRAEHKLYIAVKFIDNTLSREIIRAMERKADVRIIISNPRVEKDQQRGARFRVALQQFIGKAEVRCLDQIHCRAVMADDTVLVGSVDLDNQGLTVHDNMAIETDDPTVVRSFEDEFLRMYESARKLTEEDLGRQPR